MLTKITETFGIDLEKIQEYLYTPKYEEGHSYAPQRIEIWFQGCADSKIYAHKEADIIFVKIKEWEASRSSDSRSETLLEKLTNDVAQRMNTKDGLFT